MLKIEVNSYFIGSQFEEETSHITTNIVSQVPVVSTMLTLQRYILFLAKQILISFKLF